jgi:acetyl esterase/lipase
VTTFGRGLRKRRHGFAALFPVVIGATLSVLRFQVCLGEATSTTDPDGTVHLNNLSVPISGLLSPEAHDELKNRTGFAFSPMDLTAPTIDAVRASAERFYKPFAERLRSQYPVSVEPQQIAGVRTEVIIPESGVSTRNRDRVLINVHGGGFILGWGSGALVESIPIASVGRIKVITVDYRMAPENHFPAASEDVAAVYRTLLKQYKPQNVGIFGCSAGGALTAQAVAWFLKERLPAPGAIGIFGSTAAPRNVAGDSNYIVPPLVNFPDLGKVPYLTYLVNADPMDPLVAPAASLRTLAKFPPSLFVTSTRDPGVSGALYSHARFLKAGVDSQLLVGEGLWHCYIYDDIPEARDAYDVITKFFDRHLGSAPQGVGSHH